MRYQIVEASDTDKLSEAVQSLLVEGWQPQGGLSCFQHEGIFVCAQALIHTQDTPTQEEIDRIQSEISERLTQIYGSADNVTRQELTDILAASFVKRESDKS